MEAPEQMKSATCKLLNMLVKDAHLLSGFSVMRTF